MEQFDECNYVVECMPTGEYAAYLLNYQSCCAYGESEEEAVSRLADVAEEFFSEVNSVYFLEDIA